jgi:nucleoside-diphosphate-sugar epimerase
VVAFTAGNSVDAAFLVTGCAGFIGSHLTEALLLRGDSVIGLDSFSDYYPRAQKEANLLPILAHPRFTLVEQDLAEADLDTELARARSVFHLAGQPGVRGSWGASFSVYVRDNVLATQRLFEACARAGVRTVFASSSSVYGETNAYPTPEDAERHPRSPYGVTKLACEHLAEAYASTFGLDVVVLRYFTVYGPRQRPDMAFSRLISACLEGTPFTVYGDGDQSRDVTYVSDVVRATLAVMDAGDRVRGALNVGGGNEVSLREAIAACERLAGRRLDVQYGRREAGDVRRTLADTRRIGAALGWAPETTLADGLAAQVAEARLPHREGP